MSDLEKLAEELANFRTHCECTEDYPAHEACNGVVCVGQQRAILAALTKVSRGKPSEGFDIGAYIDAN